MFCLPLPPNLPKPLSAIRPLLNGIACAPPAPPPSPPSMYAALTAKLELDIPLLVMLVNSIFMLWVLHAGYLQRKQQRQKWTRKKRSMRKGSKNAKANAVGQRREKSVEHSKSSIDEDAIGIGFDVPPFLMAIDCVIKPLLTAYESVCDFLRWKWQYEIEEMFFGMGDWAEEQPGREAVVPAIQVTPHTAEANVEGAGKEGDESSESQEDKLQALRLTLEEINAAKLAQTKRSARGVVNEEKCKVEEAGKAGKQSAGEAIHKKQDKVEKASSEENENVEEVEVLGEDFEMVEDEYEMVG